MRASSEFVRKDYGEAITVLERAKEKFAESWLARSASPE
jgi:hypothetical protein